MNPLHDLLWGYHESFTWRVTWVVSWLPPPPWIFYMTCYVGCFVATPSTMNPWHDLLRGLFRGYPLWTHIEADIWSNVEAKNHLLETENIRVYISLFSKVLRLFAREEKPPKRKDRLTFGPSGGWSMLEVQNITMFSFPPLFFDRTEKDLSEGSWIFGQQTCFDNLWSPAPFMETNGIQWYRVEDKKLICLNSKHLNKNGEISWAFKYVFRIV